MRLLLPLLVLAACHTEGSESSLPLEAAPPPSFVLSAAPTVAPGGTVQLTVTGTLGEDERVRFLISPSGVGPGPCPASIGGLCLDLTTVLVRGSDLVDANGQASFNLVLPGSLPEGREIGFQAVVVRGVNGSESVKSNPLTVTVQSVAASGEITFDATGAPVPFTVPAGITELTVELCGAAGGDGWNTDVDTLLGDGASGGYVVADLPVTPGEQLWVVVGGRGGNGSETTAGLAGYNGGGSGAIRLNYAGGGGGGASDVRDGAGTLADRLLVAGGGGAGSGWCTAGTGHGGAGGGSIGLSGQVCSGIPVGTGGSQSAGGTFGASLGTGGSATTNGGAGGGGGYYGGGASDGSGGGGGSSYVHPSATALVSVQGACAGEGSVTIAW